MTKLPSRLPILVTKMVSAAAFVEHWASKYPLTNERAYQANIGKPLTAKRIWSLFEWKNNGPIAQHKRASIQRNYIDLEPVPPRPGNRTELIAFIQQPGGAVWRIFWLHCHDPCRYPIFDQHVYRAMRHLMHSQIEEPPVSSQGKALVYADEYVPFYRAFNAPNGKLLDQALWVYGKHLKRANAA